MATKNKIISKIEDLDLQPEDIEFILDEASITDEIVDFILKKYSSRLNEPSYFRIKNILDLFDLTAHDNNLIEQSMSKAAKRSFFSLMSKNKLSRQEIIYYIKNKIALDDEIICLFNNNKCQDLADIVLHWRPHLFCEQLEKFKEQYNITVQQVEESKRRQLQLEKFKFIN